MCVAVAAWESLQLLAGRDTHVGSSGKSTPVGALPAQSRAGLWLGLVWSRRRLFIFKLVFKISLFFFFLTKVSVFCISGAPLLLHTQKAWQDWFHIPYGNHLLPEVSWPFLKGIRPAGHQGASPAKRCP